MIADIFASRLASTNIAGYPPRDSSLAKLFGLGTQSLSGAKVDTKAALGLSPVFRGVNIIGNKVSKCKPHIYQRLNDNDQPDPTGRNKRRAMEHPSWRSTVRRANQWMSAGAFRKTLTVNAILRGNGIGHVERDMAGRVVEYLPLLPDRTGMAIFGSKVSEDSQIPEDAIVLYWTTVRGQMRTILPENIIHIRGLATNGIWGVDVIDVMRETLGLALAVRDCGARFFGNSMLGSGLLYMPKGMGSGPKGEETVKNFIKSVKEQASGLSKAHRMLVLDEGTKYEKLSVDPEQAQGLQTREFTTREIGNIVGCQSHKLGDTKRTSYASLEQSNQEHLDDDIDPWLEAWEEAIEDTALTEEEKETGSHYVECNRKALLRTNLAARGSYYTQARNGGWMSANDILRAEGEDPIGPQGDQYLIPLNMKPADQAGEDPVLTIDSDPKPTDDEEKAKLAADFQAVAMHECTRLVDRCCAEAVRKSAKSGGEFVEFVESIPKWCQDPEPLRLMLTYVGSHLAGELNKFTEPPYSATDLKANVAAAIDGIRESAMGVGKVSISTDLLARQAA